MATVDPLAGVSQKTTKAELMDKLNEMADQVRSFHRGRTRRLAEIEKRVRAKYTPGETPDMLQAVILATEDEWNDVVAFLQEFNDEKSGESFLPVGLERLRLGLPKLLEEDQD